MKKIFVIILLVTVFSCGNKNNQHENKNKPNNTSEQTSQKQESSEQISEGTKKKRIEAETTYENDLMKVKVDGGPEYKQLSDKDVTEIKQIIQKKFKNSVITAVTNDGRFFIVQAVNDPTNKEETAKEIIIDRVDIIETIGKWCKDKGTKYKFVIVQFFDLDKKERISESIYYSYILENLYEKEEYKQAISDAFDKYKRAIRY
ncbi:MULTISPECIES: hypothetical protein [unclassified Leptotrichia]|jgi:hypothetical protein|uniref:hypothetical protein n=1 Tax=unclassified Leptotrichia TaxID=2633022 RepID=UPI0003AE4038|nr:MULTISPECIES: hypothetical protein [unclassified Leptotrichia]ERL26037.1 hypothetical protein HMPREF9108_01420 [Leptotrichia sp. oral taxon 225 str. F0581]WLD73479.1 hypothetical protein QU666_07510 [Leptotrichia sp. HMT-225]